MLAIAKLLIMSFCLIIHLSTFPISPVGIIIMLTAFVLGSLSLVLNRNKGIDNMVIMILWAVFLIISLFVPLCCFYLPVMLFDVYRLKNKINNISFYIANTIILLVNMETMGYAVFAGSFILSLIVVVLSKTIVDNESHIQQLKVLRDTSKEHELLIEEKNRKLIEKQDTETYAATLRERNRIAREIHDNVGHILTRSILQTGAIKAINKDELLKEPLEGLHDSLNTAMTNIRSSVHDLHDEAIDLKTAIEDIVQTIENFKVVLNYDMGQHVHKSVKYCFIGIIKEAINNTIKHSNGDTIHIIVQEHPAFYQLLIEDNGTSISKNSSNGIGLTNMTDRVKALNGNIKISTDNGFKIMISILKQNLS